MGVDHRGLDILVPKEFLYGADVVSALEEVGCEAVAEGVGAHFFIYSGEFGGMFDGFLYG